MKRIFCIILAVSLMLLCGCGSGEETGTLRICIDGNGLNEMFIAPILVEFQNQNPGITLEVEYLPAYKADDAAMIEERAAAFTRTRTELMSGEGADVYLFLSAYGSSSDPDSYMLFPDLERNIMSGALHNLDFLFEDERFNAGDYISALDTTGVYEGKSYVLPLSYQVFGLVGVDEALKTSGFDTEETDITAFVEQVLELGDGCPYLNGYSSTMLLNSVAMQPVSVQKADILLDEPAWQTVINLAKQIMTETNPVTTDVTAFLDYTTAAQNGAALLPGASFSMCGHSLRVLEMGGCTARFVPVPNENGGVTAQPYVTAVVSSGCENTDAAAELLLWLLSENVQGCEELETVGSAANLSFIGFSWPVRKGCGVKMLEQLDVFPVEPGTISGTLKADIEALENRINTFRIASRYDSSLSSLVSGYINGTETWDECWENIQSTWKYLDE